MSALADLFTMVAVSAGILFFLAGVVGLLRFPDAMTRLHALTKADNVGLGLVVAGLLPQAGSPLEALKLVLVWLTVLLAGATVGQLIARVARRAGTRR
jgi:multicomponent Na+:H+ antiporter subunit G